MERRNTISILENILETLKKDEELSFNQLQKKTKTQWRTMKSCVEFLVKVGLIKERRGESAPNPERLFSLYKLKTKSS